MSPTRAACFSLCLSCLLLAGCPRPEAGPPSPPADQAAASPAGEASPAGDQDAACCAEAPPGGLAGLPSGSLYQLSSVWRDHTGAERRLSDFQGRVQVVSMIFTHCQYACPMILTDLRKIEEALPANQRGAVRFLLVSFDSARDTPEVLERYAEQRGLDLERYTLLQGAEGDVRELAAALGVTYKQTPTGDFSHASVITVLEPEGEIVHQQQGLGADPQPALAAIAEAAS